MVFVNCRRTLLDSVVCHRMAPSIICIVKSPLFCSVLVLLYACFLRLFQLQPLRGQWCVPLITARVIGLHFPNSFLPSLSRERDLDPAHLLPVMSNCSLVSEEEVMTTAGTYARTVKFSLGVGPYSKMKYQGHK